MTEGEQHNNIEFLEKINPIKIILWAFFVWSILFFTAPLVINIVINTDAYILIFFNILAFILGSLFYRSRTKSIIIPRSNKHIRKLFMIVFYLAVLGLTAKFIDRFFIRGISIEADFFSNRETMEQGGGNALAIISAILTPMGLIPLFLMWKYKLGFNKIFKLVVFVLFFAQLFDAFLLGSRSIMFVLFILIGLFLFYFKKLQLTLKKTILIIIAFLSFMLLMNYIFLERTKAFAGDKAYEIVLNQSNFNYTLTSNKEFKQEFRKMNPVYQTIAFTYITTVQYFTHGMIEFTYLYGNFNQDHSFGQYTFNVYARFLSKITGAHYDAKELQELAPRQGVYTTFFGPLFIDFGWISILFMLFFGKIVRSVHEKARKGSDWAILMYFYFFIVLMFSPVFNFINGAGGIFILTSFILFFIISKNFYKYEKIS